MKIYTIKLYFFGSQQQVVPFNYRDKLLSFLFNDILGQNSKYHDSISLYSTSPLFNSKTVENGLLFDKGAIWLLRTPSIDVFKDFYLKAKNAITKELGYGLVLKTVEYSVKEFKNISELTVGTSPIYLGQNENSKERDHITYKHGNQLCSEHLKRTLITKACLLGYNLNLKNFNIEFDLTQPIETKPLKIGDNTNIVTQGKVKITGDSNVIGLCYGLGFGISTGCGFGFVFNIK